MLLCSLYGTRLELVYTFCEFLAEVSRVNNQTLQKTCIKPYLFTYLPFNVPKTHGKSWKIEIFSLIFRKLSPTQTAYCKNRPQKYSFKRRAADHYNDSHLERSSKYAGGENCHALVVSLTSLICVSS